MGNDDPAVWASFAIMNDDAPVRIGKIQAVHHHQGFDIDIQFATPPVKHLFEVGILEIQLTGDQIVFLVKRSAGHKHLDGFHAAKITTPSGRDEGAADLSLHMLYLLRTYLLMAILITPGCGLFAQDPESVNPMQGIVDVQQYDLELWIHPGDTAIRGKITIDLEMIKTVNELILQLEDLRITSLKSNSGKTNFKYDGKQIFIRTRKNLKPGKSIRLVLEYEGKPSDGLIIKQNETRYTVFADNWASRARNWFPSVDHPSDKARFHVTVHTMDPFEVIANGVKIDESGLNGQKTIIYHMDHPIPTYCMVIGLAQMSIASEQTAGGIPLYYYTYREDSSLARESFKRVADMVQFYDSLIGAFPYDRLSLVQSSTRFGGMENSSAIFLADQGAVYRRRSNPEGLLAHEIAHQWFGDAVTQSSWADLWLSESFATYFSALYFEARDGKNKFDSILDQTRSVYLRRSPKKAPVIYDGYPQLFQMMNAENYQKGALFLHALRQAIGEAAFFTTIRKYYALFKHRNASTADFQALAEAESRKGLDDLFTIWLRRPGLPE